MENNNIIYSVNDLIDILKISRVTILKYIKSGEIKAAYIGNQYRVRKEDLDAFVDSKRK